MNAFAVPGGYIYVTRGLLALANNEAEVSGVLAHEIGHIAARHSAERYSKGVLLSIPAVLLGVVTGSQEVANLAGSAGAAYLQSYSRDQEYQADLLGVRYLSRTNYDPYGMASFLAQLASRRQARFANWPAVRKWPTRPTSWPAIRARPTASSGRSRRPAAPR